MVAPYWCGLVTKCSATRLPTSWGERPAGQLVKYVASCADALKFSANINDAHRDAILSLSNRFISLFPRRICECQSHLCHACISDIKELLIGMHGKILCICRNPHVQSRE